MYENDKFWNYDREGLDGVWIVLMFYFLKRKKDNFEVNDVMWIFDKVGNEVCGCYFLLLFICFNILKY